MLSLQQCENKKFLVFGIGLTGNSSAKQLSKNKAIVEFWDDDLRLRQKYRKKYNLCNNYFKKDFDFILLSPGVNIYNHQHKDYFIQNKHKIITDLDIFINTIESSNVILITGTNGKSTASKLVFDVLKTANKRAYLGGNFGKPVLDLPLTGKDIFYVIEISSYQLDYASTIYCRSAVVLNITPDHLERHISFKNYALIKFKVFKGLSQNSFGYYFDRFNFVNFDKNLKKNIFFLNEKKVSNSFLRHNENLKGNFNKRLIFYLLKICENFDIKKKTLVKVLKKFKGLEHRQEIVKSNKQVLIINDSKATNFNSCEAALASFYNIRWIVGGLPKKNDKILVNKFKSKIIKAYIIGKHYNFFKKFLKNKIAFKISKSLKQAIKDIHRDFHNTKKRFQTILLSPAAASFDQYKNFVERGNKFKLLMEKYKWNN